MCVHNEIDLHQKMMWKLEIAIQKHCFLCILNYILVTIEVKEGKLMMRKIIGKLKRWSNNATIAFIPTGMIPSIWSK